jgi:hypothetical protein
VLLAHLTGAAFAVVVLATTGCGNSSKTSTATAASATTTATTTSSTPTASTPTTTTISPVVIATGKPLTHAQWLAKGDAICARLNTQLAANGVKSLNEFARVLPEVAAYEHTELTQLVKLVPPPSQREDWQKFLNETREWAENSAKLGQSAQTTQFTLTEPLVVTTRKLHERLARVAKREGFKECSLT